MMRNGVSLIGSFLREASIVLADAVLAAISDVTTALEDNRFALLNGGLPELYYLPLRLTRLMGWIGFAAHVRAALDGDLTEVRESARLLLAKIFEHYSLSLTAMSDAQASYLAIALTGLTILDLHEEGEQLASYMFASFVESGGRPTRADILPDKILGYLIARHRGDFSDALDQIAHPTELGAVLLHSAPLFGLTDVFDEGMEAIDHLTINAYIAEDLRAFGDEMIANGANATYTIGRDIWTVEDLRSKWPIVPHAPGPVLGLTAMLAALLFPDRVPWFVYDCQDSKGPSRE